MEPVPAGWPIRSAASETAAGISLDAVDFDQADAGGIIFAARNRCPVPLNVAPPSLP